MGEMKGEFVWQASVGCRGANGVVGRKMQPRRPLVGLQHGVRGPLRAIAAALLGWLEWLRSFVAAGCDMQQLQKLAGRFCSRLTELDVWQRFLSWWDGLLA